MVSLRLLVAAAALAAGAALAWLAWQRAMVPGGVDSTPGGAPATSASPPDSYRLAGVAFGDHGAYAVFEDAGGDTRLFRIGDAVPGLGTLSRVAEGRAMVRTEHGEIEFSVRPAHTRTPEPPRPTAAPSVTGTPPPRPAHTAPESPLSAAPDRPAS